MPGPCVRLQLSRLEFWRSIFRINRAPPPNGSLSLSVAIDSDDDAQGSVANDGLQASAERAHLRWIIVGGQTTGYEEVGFSWYGSAGRRNGGGSRCSTL